tara:strand:- start:595 stop:1374 length:780 start_codon:yes stop_codon:yes gene_type:complete
MKPLEMYKMKDKTDSFTIKKDRLFDLPMRLLMVGKTGSAKTTKLGNLLLRPEPFYRNDFDPTNIFIFSGSLKGDMKLREIINQLEIPESNTFEKYDDDIGNAIYDMIVDNFNNAIANKERPNHTLFVFDDLGFSNMQNQTHKKNDILNRILCNGRKYLISTITLNQRITQVSRNAREQVSGAILHKCSNKDLEMIEGDFNYMKNKKDFRDLFLKNTEGQFDFLVINFSNGSHIYQDKNFANICTCPKNMESKCGGKRQD